MSIAAVDYQRVCYHFLRDSHSKRLSFRCGTGLFTNIRPSSPPMTLDRRQIGIWLGYINGDIISTQLRYHGEIIWYYMILYDIIWYYMILYNGVIAVPVESMDILDILDVLPWGNPPNWGLAKAPFVAWGDQKVLQTLRWARPRWRITP